MMPAHTMRLLTGALLVAAVLGSASGAGATPPAAPTPHPAPSAPSRPLPTPKLPPHIAETAAVSADTGSPRTPTTIALTKNHKDTPANAKTKATAAAQPASAGSPGTLFVRKSDNEGAYQPKAVYLGKFGGKNYGLEGDWLVVLSNDTVEQNHLHASADLPLIPKQLVLGDGVSASLSYLQHISGAKSGAGVATSETITASLTPSPFFASFFPRTFQSSTTVPPRGTALVQKDGVHDALEKSGLKVTATSSLDTVFAALEKGQKVFVGVKAADGRTTVQDEHDGSIKSVSALEPYHGGAEGHAMVAVGAVRNQFGERVMVLAEPSSGALITMKEKHMQGALQYGLVVE